ncbi:MAG: DNA ligase [Desulfoplanes sp.]|nr:DNA ligase [Desulfoplanes sp.]MDD4649619.1 DNA ligase [Desulfoplanes sp.]
MKYYRDVPRSFLFLIIPFCLLSTAFTAAASPELQTPQTYHGNESITGWYMSEKLDGIRGYWDGQRLLSKEGTLIHIPSWFTAQFPPFELDGELWAGRGNFQNVQSTVMDQNPSPQWYTISYNIFEVPHAPGDFPTRLNKAQQWFDQHNATNVHIIAQQPCTGHEHVQQFLKKIAKDGGEGVIIKDPSIPYRDGSGQRVLKIKHIEYMDGTVMGHTPGKGKYTGLMGSLTLKLENGIIFKLGSGFSMNERHYAPRIGAVVTFKHYGFSKNGTPRFASFVKVKKP